MTDRSAPEDKQTEADFRRGRWSRRAAQALFSALLLFLGFLVGLPSVLRSLWAALRFVLDTFMDMLPMGHDASDVAIRHTVISIVIGGLIRWLLKSWFNTAVLLYGVGAVGFVIHNYASWTSWGYATIVVALAIGSSRLHLSAERWRLRYQAALAASDPRPPILLLRSFVHDRLLYKPEKNGIGRGKACMAEIAQAVAPLGVPIMLGHPPAIKGTDFSEVLFLPSTDKDWGVLFASAARAAAAVVIIPETTPGLVREILRVLGSDLLLPKTLIVMPTADSDLGRKALKSRWQVVRAEWRREGFELPDYEDDGSVFRPTPQFGVAKAWRVAPDGLAAVSRSAILDIKAREGLVQHPLSELMELIALDYDPVLGKFKTAENLYERLQGLARQLLPEAGATRPLLVGTGALSHAIITPVELKNPSAFETELQTLGRIQREQAKYDENPTASDAPSPPVVEGDPSSSDDVSTTEADTSDVGNSGG